MPSVSTLRWLSLGGLLRRRAPQGPPSLIVVGLGNPGPEYADTRHNIGYRFVDRIARANGVTLSRRHRSAIVGEGTIDGHPIVLAKPRTFVNRSGEAVSYLLTRYRTAAEGLLIVYDEMELPLGKVRLRPRGSAGGHNGIKSIVDALGTQDFPRLRIGIGRPSGDSDPIAYVLGVPGDEEQAAVLDSIEFASKVAVTLLTEGIDVAMNRYN